MTENQPSNSPSEERIERARRFRSLFQARSLINVSQEEVGKAALGYTQARFNVLSGTPEVAHIRSLKVSEIPATGLGEINFAGEEPPLMLVVVKGDFDISSLLSDRYKDFNVPRRVKYIAYVFDLRAGIPSLTATGLTGGYFRNVLKDQSLPDAPTEVIGPKLGMPEALPGPVVEPPARKLPYGVEVPGENPQTP